MILKCAPTLSPFYGAFTNLENMLVPHLLFHWSRFDLAVLPACRRMPA